MLNLPSLSSFSFVQPIQQLSRFSLLNLPLNLRVKAINITPNILRPTLALLPFALQKKLLLPTLQAIFKEAIEDGDFEFLQNRWLKISITDLNLHWMLSFDDNSLLMKNIKEQPHSDVSFSATGDDLVLIAGRKQDPDTLFFQRRLKIEGDTELGLEVKNLIDAIELEQLPNLVHKFVEHCAQLLQQTHDELVNSNNV